MPTLIHDMVKNIIIYKSGIHGITMVLFLVTVGGEINLLILMILYN